MNQRGMIRHKCPVCKEYIFRDSSEIDFVHQCRKANGQRKTTRTDFDYIPMRINIKFDKAYFTNLGLNPYPKVRSEKEKKDSCYEEINVDTFIEFDEIEEE